MFCLLRGPVPIPGHKESVLRFPLNPSELPPKVARHSNEIILQTCFDQAEEGLSAFASGDGNGISGIVEYLSQGRLDGSRSGCGTKAHKH